MVASLVLAMQSVLMLIAISRTGALEDAGMFSFGFANANLFLNMGRFGMRNYQVSDAVGRFSFGVYLRSRYATVTLMMAVSTVYVLVANILLGYGVNKMLVIVLLCALKAEDAYEDVYQANYQRNGYLDVASNLLTARLVMSVIVFFACMYTAHSMVFALALSNIVCMIFICGEIAFMRHRYGLPNGGAQQSVEPDGASSQVLVLLRDCFPLFIAAFASFFITNAPKYAIDATGGDSMQAIFGYLFMPVFVVNLVANSIFQPQVSVLAERWEAGDRAAFKAGFNRQMLLTVGIAVLCTIAATTAGIPVLEALYHVQLGSYAGCMAILMMGGGANALLVLLLIGITILRAQQGVGKWYAALAPLSLIIAYTFVSRFGIPGASISYLMVMSIQVMVFFVLMRHAMKHAKGSQCQSRPSVS